MLRELMAQSGKPIPANYIANTAMKTGMGVVIDSSTGKVKFPTSATAANIYVVDKERLATGINTAYAEYSDYFDEFVTVKADDTVKIVNYKAGERFATDQVAAAVTSSATNLYVGTDGKWTTSSSATKYQYDGTYNDAGHTLTIIKVVE